MNSRHDCRPPGGKQPFTVSRWTCPDCGGVWDASPHVDPDTPPIGDSYDFGTGEHMTTSRWARREDAD